MASQTGSNIDPSKDTTVILVHGMWHQASHYKHLIPYLSKSYNILTPELPTSGADPALPSAEADITAIRAAISSAVTAGQKVVLVMHSYAGIPGSEAVKGLTVADLKAQAQSPSQSHQNDGRGVTHLVYIAAFVPRVGDTILTMSDGPASWIRISDDQTKGFVDTPREVFYSDITDDVVVEEAIKGLRPQSLSPIFHAATYAAYKDVPATYVQCDADRCVTTQDRVLRQIKDDKPLDLKVVVFEGCGHSPMINRAEETSRVIRDAAETAL